MQKVDVDMITYTSMLSCPPEYTVCVIKLKFPSSLFVIVAIGSLASCFVNVGA